MNWSGGPNLAPAQVHWLVSWFQDAVTGPGAATSLILHLGSGRAGASCQG